MGSGKGLMKRATSYIITDTVILQPIRKYFENQNCFKIFELKICNRTSTICNEICFDQPAKCYPNVNENN